MPRVVREEIARAANLGNPSSEYFRGRKCESQQVLQNLRAAVAGQCGVSLEEFAVLLTSGGSEANNLIIRSVASAYAEHTRARPHLVSSTVEHKTTLECLEQLRRRRLAEVSLVPPDEQGRIPPEEVARRLRPNTALVSVMHANNETGAVNDVEEIGRRCHAFAHEGRRISVPFHTDAVQTFGKTPPRLEPHIDAASVSFHKLHGPPGMGALVVRRELIENFRLEAEICGSQNEGLRGGTENVIGAAGALMAMQYTFANRAAKNRRMHECRLAFLRELSRQKVELRTRGQFHAIHNAHLAGDHSRIPPKPFVVLLTPLNEDASGRALSTPNTLLLAIVDYSREVCNADIKNALARAGVLVSIGSACNTDSPKASHVLGDLPAVVRRGTLRISVGDETLPEDMPQVARLLRDFGTSVPKSLSKDF